MVSMEAYSVMLLPPAQKDLQDAMKHLDTLDAEESRGSSFERFFRSIGILTSSPESCAFAKDTQLRLRGYRILQAENYIVFYVVKDKKVEIRRILFARRHYDHLV